MSEIVQKYESRNLKPDMSIVGLFFLIPTVIFFIIVLMDIGVNGNMHIVYFVIFLIIFDILLFRDLIKPRLLLGESFIGIPKVTIFFRRTHKIIKFEDIKRIIIVPSDSVKELDDSMNNVYSIYILDKKDNLHKLWGMFQEKIFANNLKKRIGDKQWDSKLLLENGLVFGKNFKRIKVI